MPGSEQSRRHLKKLFAPNWIRRIANAEKDYAKKKAKRNDIESRMPKDYICTTCLEFVGSNYKDWQLNQIDLIQCIKCSQSDLIESRWDTLDITKRITLVFETIYKHEFVFRKLCRFDEEIFDAAVTDRIENLTTNYDPTKGILYSYLKSSVGWYAYKAASARTKQNEREITEASLSDEDNYVIDDLVIDQTPIFELLESLHPFDQWLIEQHIINGWSQQELADAAKRSKATINVWMAQICDKLRREFHSLQER